MVPIEVFRIEIRKKAEFFCNIWIVSNEKYSKASGLTSLLANLNLGLTVIISILESIMQGANKCIKVHKVES